MQKDQKGVKGQETGEPGEIPPLKYVTGYPPEDTPKFPQTQGQHWHETREGEVMATVMPQLHGGLDGHHEDPPSAQDISAAPEAAESAPHLQDHPSQHIGPPMAPETAE